MSLDPLYGLHPPREARYVFGCLYRRGGTMRIGPLVRLLGMDQQILLHSILELGERYWITIEWRKTAPDAAAEDLAVALGDIRRITTTRFGRRKYRSCWALD